MDTRTKYFIHRNHFWFIAAIIVTALVLAVVLYRRNEDWRVLLPVIGGTVSLIYIIERQFLEEARLFKELFVDFNRRYNRLNKDLNRIRNADIKLALERKDIDILYDYFNLCGEEFLFYKKGYVYPEVWKSWILGMKIFFDNNRIRAIWVHELQTDSYYGLDLQRELLKLRR